MSLQAHQRNPLKLVRADGSRWKLLEASVYCGTWWQTMEAAGTSRQIWSWKLQLMGVNGSFYFDQQCSFHVLPRKLPRTSTQVITSVEVTLVQWRLLQTSMKRHTSMGASQLPCSHGRTYTSMGVSSLETSMGINLLPWKFVEASVEVNHTVK